MLLLVKSETNNDHYSSFYSFKLNSDYQKLEDAFSEQKIELQAELDEIIEQVLSFDCDRVIFTGGEPAMQDLATIGSSLKEHGLHLSIESNGTMPVDPIIDWICISPKDQMYPNTTIKQRTGDELKVVYCGQDMGMYDEYKDGFQHHFIQPCYIEDESVEANGIQFRAVEDLVKRSPGWRLSLQTHKWMGVL